MTIEEADAVGTHQHDGVTYYFCNPSCLERIRRTIRSHSSSAANAATPPPAGATFICPMDPEVRRQSPGRARSAAWRSSRTCPILPR